ncbi:TIM barrel protein [Actinomycetes bacterium KLBMP 9759]
MSLQFGVNLSILFTELPLLQRPAAAAAAGFDAVEMWWPFDGPEPSDKELDALAGAITDAGTRLVGLNFDAGDIAAGNRGLLSRPGDSARFLANIDVATGFAGRMGTTVLNALYGNRDPEVGAQAQEELATENLVLAAQAAQRVGATVVIEALNSFESPNYPVTTSKYANYLVERVRSSGQQNVGFLADLYHLARMGEPVQRLVEDEGATFGHVQIADTPGRGQPGTGELDWPALLGGLDASGYRGHVGLEYRAVGPSADSFGWLSTLEEAA